VVFSFPYLLLPSVWSSRNRARRRERGDLTRGLMFGGVGMLVCWSLFHGAYWLTSQLESYEELGDYLLRLGLSWIFMTFLAFLTWFGGVGYLLTGRGHWGSLIILFAATAAGLFGAAILFGFLTRVLLKHERSLSFADFEMVGVLGRITVPIRAEGGTGEIVYSQAGTRRSAAARSESGQAIVRGAEVVVTRYENGIAFVRLWEELARREQVIRDTGSS